MRGTTGTILGVADSRVAVRLPRDLSVETDGGRILGARLAGAADGPLVAYLHGAPSSRLDVDYLHERSERRGIRLVGIDRPGYGRSTPMAFTHASVARDVGVVADAVGSYRFAVFGFSAGVSYALATAAELPERVTAVATAGGGMPILPGTKRWEGLSEEQKRVVLAGDEAATERMFAEGSQPVLDELQRSDDEIEAAWMARAGPADQRVLAAGFGRQTPLTMREAMRQGAAGWARDDVLRVARWGFDLGAVRAAASIWIGEGDSEGNVEGAHWLVDQIPGAALRELPDHGHLVAFELWDEVLDSLGL